MKWNTSVDFRHIIKSSDGWKGKHWWSCHNAKFGSAGSDTHGVKVALKLDVIQSGGAWSGPWRLKTED